MRCRPDLGTLLGVLVILAVAAAMFVLELWVPAHAAGWSDDPQMQKWFAEAPVKKCCALADGFEADLFENTDSGGAWVIITDSGEPVCWDSLDYSEDDGAGELVHSCRRDLPDQRRFYVTTEQIRWMPPNPTGHGVLFIDRNNKVLCYFWPSGA